MTREQKLQAVVDAARKVVHAPICREPTKEILVLADTLAALDAHTEVPQETVTLAVWATSDGAVALVTPGTRCDHPDHPLDRRLGTVTLPLDREGGR